MPTVSDLFRRLGGPARVGEAIGKPVEHAAQIRRRGSIPVRYWPAFVAAKPVEGFPPVTTADLVAAHAPVAASANEPELARVG